MIAKGRVLKTDKDLPDSSSITTVGTRSVPYYECNKCKMDEKSRFAYQRTLINGKWYFYNYAKWNFLKEEIFNPSRRMEN
jgi:hypothetical protein